jgi:Fe-S cluster assembly iron-binding protein IscA
MFHLEDTSAKDTIFWQKRPKTIVIRIIVLDDNIQIYSYGLLCERLEPENDKNFGYEKIKILVDIIPSNTCTFVYR